MTGAVREREILFDGRRLTALGEEGASRCLIHVTEESEETGPLVDAVRDASGGEPWLFLPLPVSDWNSALSPWEAPPVFGDAAFGGGAQATLSRIGEALLPALRASCLPAPGARYFLSGYSLAGLFALFAGYRSSAFYGVAAVSPSVWFPSWDRLAREERMRAKRVYLSLGDREDRTRHPVMRTVSERIRLEESLLLPALGRENVLLEWNGGGHFRDPEGRTAKGIRWLLKG
ncbi:MAG: esterase [Clostridia bacterium]|nr:esterase [Clostridia bacterium]